VDPKVIWQISPDQIASKSKNTPFLKIDLPGKVIHTLLRGEFTVKNSKVSK
jgi:dihydroorotase